MENAEIIKPILTERRKSPVPSRIRQWTLGKKIGSGSFGQIYAAKHSCGSDAAVKLEHAAVAHPQVLYEARVLKCMSESEGFPRVYWYGVCGHFSVMIMELLGPSLEEVFAACRRQFSVITTCLLGLQMIDRIETLHSNGFLHRDIKPDNFLIGQPGTVKQNKVHAIDFGLAKKFVEKSGRHIAYREGQNLTGTARYASINTHLGKEQSRRDDLEGLVYVLVYFLKGCLPWQGLKVNGRREKYHNIMKKKIATEVAQLTLDLPRQVGDILLYVRGLSFTAVPEYILLRQLLIQAAWPGQEAAPEVPSAFDSFISDWWSYRQSTKECTFESSAAKGHLPVMKDFCEGPLSDGEAILPKKGLTLMQILKGSSNGNNKPRPKFGLSVCSEAAEKPKAAESGQNLSLSLNNCTQMDKSSAKKLSIQNQANLSCKTNIRLRKKSSNNLQTRKSRGLRRNVERCELGGAHLKRESDNKASPDIDSLQINPSKASCNMRHDSIDTNDNEEDKLCLETGNPKCDPCLLNCCLSRPSGKNILPSARRQNLSGWNATSTLNAPQPTSSLSAAHVKKLSDRASVQPILSSIHGKRVNQLEPTPEVCRQHLKDKQSAKESRKGSSIEKSACARPSRKISGQDNQELGTRLLNTLKSEPSSSRIDNFDSSRFHLHFGDAVSSKKVVSLSSPNGNYPLRQGACLARAPYGISKQRNKTLNDARNDQSSAVQRQDLRPCIISPSPKASCFQRSRGDSNEPTFRKLPLPSSIVQAFPCRSLKTTVNSAKHLNELSKGLSGVGPKPEVLLSLSSTNNPISHPAPVTCRGLYRSDFKQSSDSRNKKVSQSSSPRDKQSKNVSGGTITSKTFQNCFVKAELRQQQQPSPSFQKPAERGAADENEKRAISLSYSDKEKRDSSKQRSRVVRSSSSPETRSEATHTSRLSKTNAENSKLIINATQADATTAQAEPIFSGKLSGVLLQSQELNEKIQNLKPPNLPIPPNFSGNKVIEQSAGSVSKIR